MSDPNIRNLSLKEKRFLLFVERGDVASVGRMLKSGEDEINVNCVDPLGRSALVIAIENENMDLMKLLLNFGIEMKEAILHAINEEYVEGVEVLLEHEKLTIPPGQQHSWERVDGDGATYTPDVTPLILAAHKNNYEILKLLLNDGATLSRPHDVKCGCDECVLSCQRDSLCHSRSRINAYAALVSPSLIALTSRDPILTAFQLSRELKRLSMMENEFKTEYQLLRNKVEDFATNLLDYVRTSTELVTILNYDPKEHPHNHQEQSMGLTRLKMAIKYEQKKFVAHSNVQQLLGSVWYDGMPGFRRKSMLGQVKEVIYIGMLFPVHALLYFFAPHSNRGQKLRRPFVKFINYSTSYCFFLFLLVLVSQRVENGLMKLLELEDSSRVGREALPTYVEWAIIVYIFGFIWAELKELFDGGLVEYLRDMWNMVDICTNLLYLVWIGLRITSWIKVKQGQLSGNQSQPPREEWDAFDPMLISEGIFGAANICSFLKMVHMFSVNEHLGPLQISLGRMVFDILKFFSIYVLVLFAFGCGMNQLLWYYADIDKQRCYNRASVPTSADSTSCEIWRRFANLFETSQTLFWASFGLVDLKNFELTGIKSYTRFWGLLMFGAYSVINVVILLNLLIAMMSNSYQIISECSDTEWKFARSRLWISYFDDGSTLPPPFNIIPTPKSAMQVCRIHRLVERKSVKIRKEQDRDSRYQIVMSRIIHRYITREQQSREIVGINEDDINEVKQYINSFRYELMNVLHNNGIDCTSTNKTKINDENNGNEGEDNPLLMVKESTAGKKERFKERRLMKGFSVGVMDLCLEEKGLDGEKTPMGPSWFRRIQGPTKSQKPLWSWNFLMTSAARIRAEMGGSVRRGQGSTEWSDSDNEATEGSIHDTNVSTEQLACSTRVVKEGRRPRKLTLNPLGQHLMELVREYKPEVEAYNAHVPVQQCYDCPVPIVDSPTRDTEDPPRTPDNIQDVQDGPNIIRSESVFSIWGSTSVHILQDRGSTENTSEWI